MGREIERKFLVDPEKLKLPDNGERIKQGYLPMSDAVKTVVRIRICGERAYLTIKGENRGAVRAEYEYPVPVEDAAEILEEMCRKPFIDKTRYKIKVGEHTWEVDIFHGENRGLTVAEIELSDEDEKFEMPVWVTDEVTDDPMYYNSNLLLNPYCQRQAAEEACLQK